MAQSVPTASWVPCLGRRFPLGWGFQHLDARNGRGRFFLNSDRDGQQAIEVRLDGVLRHRGATEIRSDREGMRRFERVTRTTPRYEGERYYVFDGRLHHLRVPAVRRQPWRAAGPGDPGRRRGQPRGPARPGARGERRSAHLDPAVGNG